MRTTGAAIIREYEAQIGKKNAGTEDIPFPFIPPLRVPSYGRYASVGAEFVESVPYRGDQFLVVYKVRDFFYADPVEVRDLHGNLLLSRSEIRRRDGRLT